MTLKDIAALAGVSTMTVSNVINGKHQRVSQTTIDKVTAIIEQYHYVPNQTARNLIAKSSKIIALLVPTHNHFSELHAFSTFDNPYVAAMLGEIELTLRENGYYPMIRSVVDETDILNLFQSWNIDGAIFLYPSFDHIIENLMSQVSIPMVLIDSSLESENILNVKCANEEGTYLSTNYLISKGHRHIAFVANYKNNNLLQNRFNGYLKALKLNGIPFDESLVFEISPSYTGGIEAGKLIAASTKTITAVVTTADICAIGIMEGAHLSGLHIPKDLSIVGFDDIFPSVYTTPKLTTISQNLKTKAGVAANLLIEKLTHGNVEKSQITIGVTLVARESVASPSK